MGTPANLEALAALGVRCDADRRRRGDRRRRRRRRRGRRARRAPRASSAPPAAPSAGAATEPPRSLGAAARALGDANLALISVPGAYAALEAHRALSEGLHVFLFSDHVSAADEVELKRRGAERGLLVMGPGCGTAMLGDVGLGFANVVRQGPVGIVAAAGTGAQEASVLLDGAGDRRVAHRRRGRPRPVGGGRRDHVRARRCGCSSPTTRPRRCCSSPSRRRPSVVRELGDIDVAGKRVGGRVRRLGRRRGAVRGPPDARRRRVRGRAGRSLRPST